LLSLANQIKAQQKKLNFVACITMYW